MLCLYLNTTAASARFLTPLSRACFCLVWQVGTQLRGHNFEECFFLFKVYYYNEIIQENKKRFDACASFS